MKGMKGINEKQLIFVFAFTSCIPFIPVHILLFLLQSGVVARVLGL
jgi:hypothetical protein